MTGISSVMQEIVIYQEGARFLAQSYFGRALADEEIAHLAGALDGAEVIVSARRIGLYLEVKDTRFQRYETSIRQDTDGSLFAFLHHIYAAQPKQGFGLAAFARQVAAARKLGLKGFRLYAAGYYKSDENGYYTWARYGFDAPLRAEEQEQLPAAYRGVQTVNELIQNGGQSWWQRRGDARAMYFDLSLNSAMMKTFRAYLREKGIKEP